MVPAGYEEGKVDGGGYLNELSWWDVTVSVLDRPPEDLSHCRQRGIASLGLVGFGGTGNGSFSGGMSEFIARRLGHGHLH